jgi:hypothetical protein
MKKLLFSVFTFAILGLEAQIFINTVPVVETNTNDSTSTITGTPVEVETATLEDNAVPEVKAPVQVKAAPAEVKAKAIPVPVSTSPAIKGSSEVASNATEDVPPNAEPGKCYARCLVEDKYDYVNEAVVSQPKMIRQMKLPALYKTVYDTLVITPAVTKSYTVSAEYEYVKEQVMLTPTTQKWVKGKADEGCLSANPADCQVMCLVEVPATYNTIEKKILKNQAYTREESMPMQYKIVTREVLVEAEKIIQIETPAAYKTVQKRVVVEKGGYQVWREILCGNDLTSEKIIQIQKALKAKGYNPGPIDDVFGPLTKKALIQYQKDKALPVGNLNLETLKSLGVN